MCQLGERAHARRVHASQGYRGPEGQRAVSRGITRKMHHVLNGSFPTESSNFDPESETKIRIGSDRQRRSRIRQPQG